jgi:hypothetical protein
MLRDVPAYHFPCRQYGGLMFQIKLFPIVR